MTQQWHQAWPREVNAILQQTESQLLCRYPIKQYIVTVYDWQTHFYNGHPKSESIFLNLIDSSRWLKSNNQAWSWQSLILVSFSGMIISSAQKQRWQQEIMSSFEEWKYFLSVTFVFILSIILCHYHHLVHVFLKKKK